MCYVTATDLKNNLSFYLEKSLNEDVYITKNNKVISVLMNPQMRALLDSRRMIEDLEIDNTITMSDREIIEEAIEKRWGFSLIQMFI